MIQLRKHPREMALMQFHGAGEKWKPRNDILFFAPSFFHAFVIKIMFGFGYSELWIGNGSPNGNEEI